VAGELDAADPREATLRLQQLGYVPLETASGSAAPQAGGSMFSFRRSVTRREITVFLRELALVLRAGLPLDGALHLLAGEENAGLAAVARDLRAAITAGASFAEALKPYPRIFGPDLVAMVRVAEASGKLDAVLESVAEERAKMERLIDKVSSSLRYPAFLLIASVGVLVFFLVVVVPQFASVIRDFGQAPEGLVGLVLAASDFLLAHGSVLAAILAAMLLVGLLALRRPQVRRFAKYRVARLPGLRGILELRRTVLFCSSLSTLLGNGVTLTEALRVLVDLPSGEGLDRVVEAVRRGGRFVEALGRNAYLPPLAVKMLRVGEESGELAVVARRTSEFYEAKLSDRLDRIAGVVGPAAIVVIATIIGGLIVSILSALLSVNQLVT
jgi:general secretion pathway protein F